MRKKRKQKMKTFNVAGTSFLNGRKTYRFAASMQRESVLRANGHTDVKLFELPAAMVKEGAIAWLATHHNIVVEMTDGLASSALDNDTLEAPRSTDTSYKPYVPYLVSDEYNPAIAATAHINAWFVKRADPVVETVVVSKEQRAIDYAAKRAAIKREQRAAIRAAKEMA
jgi:hypothetical protein